MRTLNIYHCQSKIPPGAVYIGRAHHKLGLTASVFANPFAITKERTREKSIDLYRGYLDQMINSGRIERADLLSLDGKDLVCFCAPKSCHGDVLIEKIQELKQETATTNTLKIKP